MPQKQYTPSQYIKEDLYISENTPVKVAAIYPDNNPGWWHQLILKCEGLDELWFDIFDVHYKATYLLY